MEGAAEGVVQVVETPCIWGGLRAGLACKTTVALEAGCMVPKIDTSSSYTAWGTGTEACLTLGLRLPLSSMISLLSIMPGSSPPLKQ